MSAHAPGICEKCGGPTGSKQVTQCAKCYRTRGSASAHVDLVRQIPWSYDEALAQYRRYIGQTSPPSRPASPRKFSTERIVIASDFHAPFHHVEALVDLLKVEADTFILAGDLQDHYSISRFLKYQSVPMSQELAAAQFILDAVAAKFPRVRCIEGNHDTPRFEKLLADRLPHEAIDIIRYLSKTGDLSSMRALCGQFKNVELVTNMVNGHQVGWYLQHGDLLVTHAEKYSVVPGAALRGIERWFSMFDQTLGLQPWRMVVQAHTHAMAMFAYGSDQLLVECGCMCQVHGYQLQARIAGTPQRLGWVTLEQRDGVTNFDSVRLRWWQG